MVRPTEDVPMYDVRRLAAAKKQSAILSMFDALGPGQSFRVICDFEPTRLKRLFAAFFGEEHRWICHEQGPPLWQIEVGRAGHPHNGE